MSASSPMDFDSSFPSLSPSTQTSYSSDDGDNLRTPFIDHAERDVSPQLFDQDHSYASPGGLDHSPSNPFHFNTNFVDQHQCSEPPFPAPFPTSMVDATESQQHTFLPTDLAAVPDSSEAAERDPFDAAFAVRNEERLTQAPLLVQTTFAEACRYSARFPAEHLLNSTFMNMYDLKDELGSGGYGFVMTAFRRADAREVAVKFIIKTKVSEHGWTEDEEYGKLPTEVMLLSLIEHEHIVKCLDLFEDRFYFYLVQELHGCPWKSAPLPPNQEAHVFSSPPLLSPSASEDSMTEYGPITPLQSSNLLLRIASEPQNDAHPDSMDFSLLQHESSPKPVPQHLAPPQFTRRPSHDLFECIEQTPNKRLSEDQARHIFAQVVEAVYYLDSQGITHRDIKDENLVIDQNLKVKLIDFGSAVIADPSKPRPFYNLFFGTTAYASSEILRKKPYQAPPAEIWTLGVLLSYLLTGMSPFPTENDAIEGRIVLVDTPGSKLSRAGLNLMRRCLEPNPDRRACINEVRSHRWLRTYHN